MSSASRRDFIRNSLIAGAAVSVGEHVSAPRAAAAAPLKIGIVTYNIAKDWDVPTIIKNCADTRFDGVELRTGHAHKVELELTSDQRREVRRRFEDSPVRLVQLGSTYEFHSRDPKEVEKNIDGCKQTIALAKDVGAAAVKVRPNGLQISAGIPVEQTLEQIGKALAKLGPVAADNGVEVRVEVHGSGTARVDYMQKVMEVANHPAITINWNSNQSDLQGGLEENFERVSSRIRHVHMRDLFVEEYPWKKLIGLLKGINFSGYCCAEIPESTDPLRVMRYFRALFMAYQG
jgi:sugar phosphate isomerase/epimerase